jgi:hypothetical protein
MTTPLVRNSIHWSPWRLGFFLLALACLALSPTASTAFAQVNVSDENSLRSAILNAAPGETINVSAGTITLTGGELVISTDLTITGQGAGVTTISGNNSSRVFFINPGAPGATTPPTTSPTVRIASLTIANGNAVGGAGYDGIGGGGGAAGLGGGLLINGGMVTVDSVTFTGNSVTGGGGGFGQCNGGGEGGGGGGVGGPGLDTAGGPGDGFGGNGGDNGSPGGEGAGGGGRAYGYYSVSGNGGFGGGGGGSFVISAGGNGGFGAGGGGSHAFVGGLGGSFGGNGGPATTAGGCGGGGGGAGLGGAIFLRSGTLNVTNSAFLTNSATGGIGGSSPGQSGTNGQGIGGAIFITDGFAANVSGLTFMNNVASDADNDVHGTLISYSAQVQQPINSDGSSVFNVHRGVVPVKFALTQGGVATCALPSATIALTRTAGGTIGSIDETTYSGSADTGSNFRIDSCQYIYNLNSGTLGSGTYRVDIFIGETVVGSGTFGLK